MRSGFIQAVGALISVGLLLAPTHGYIIEDSATIYEVAPSDRVSSTQLYARECTIVAGYYDKKPQKEGFPPISIEVNGPGVAYVTYVENTTALTTLSAVNSTTYGRVKISGSSREIISAMDCKSGEGNGIGIVEVFSQMKAIPPSDSLLIEVQVYERQSLWHFRKDGSGDAVILENVLYKPRNESETKRWKDEGRVNLEIADGRLFIHDPTAVVAPESVAITATDTGSLQAELGTLTADGDITFAMNTFGNRITMAVDQMSSVTLTAGYGTFNSSSICIASKNDVNVTSRSWAEYPKLTLSSAAYPQGTVCTLVPLPERKPAPLDPSTAKSTPTASSAATCRYKLEEVLIALVSAMATLLFTATI